LPEPSLDTLDDPSPTPVEAVQANRLSGHFMLRRPKVISLFTGAGGLDYGFEAAGFETAAAVEVDHRCCETLRHNRTWPVIERSVFEVPTQELLDAAGLSSGDPDVLIGGPPCQPFSKSGYWARGDSRRLEDPRAGTLSAYLRVLEEAQPKAFLLENVGGLAFSEKDEGLKLLLRSIKRINRRTGTRYEPVFRLLKAADYGVPQLRERFFIVASRDGRTFDFPMPTHAPAEDLDTFPGADPYMTAWDAIGDLKEPRDEELAVRGKWAELLPSIPEGQNYLFHTARGGGLPLFGWRRRYWNFLLKLAKSLPSWTVQAQPGPAVGPFHWKNRYLSARELCRIQTFPDDVTVLGDRREKQRQIGNAVPSLLAEVLARAIAGQLLDLPRRGAPKLLPRRRLPIPRPERVKAVPARLRALAGEHEAHPGTGLGYGAIARKTGTG
jgi:DNA (cytosine-5)-methyltransferase 1